MHDQPTPSDAAPRGPRRPDPVNDAVAAHVAYHVGPPTPVPPMPGTDGDVAILHVAPTDERPVHTLVTDGMSRMPMALPEAVAACRRIELVLALPAHWQLSGEGLQEARWSWPVRMLAVLAELPRQHGTWFGEGHSMANGDPPAPFHDSTRLCGAILLPPPRLPAAFHRLGEDADAIGFLSVVPLYREELALKARAGVAALLERFDRAGVGEVLVPARRNVARRRLGLF